MWLSIVADKLRFHKQNARECVSVCVSTSILLYFHDAEEAVFLKTLRVLNCEIESNGSLCASTAASLLVAIAKTLHECDIGVGIVHLEPHEASRTVNRNRVAKK